MLASLARKVYAVERIESLANEALIKLRSLGLNNVSIRNADGTKGWQVYAPFDAVLVAAGGPEVPKPLLDQLEIGGKLVIPIGEDPKSQTLVRFIRTETGFSSEDHGPCSFVPLIGTHGWDESDVRNK